MSLTHEAWSKIMQAQGGHFTAEQDRQILADYQRLEARAEARPVEAKAEAGGWGSVSETEKDERFKHDLSQWREFQGNLSSQKNEGYPDGWSAGWFACLMMHRSTRASPPPAEPPHGYVRVAGPDGGGMEVPKAGAGQVHEEPKNIEWVCAQIADCVWGCSWPPLDLTEEEISRIREGAQYLMTSLRPSPAAITEGLREAFIAGAWWHLMGCHGALTHEKAHDEAKRRYSDAALRQSAKEGA